MTEKTLNRLINITHVLWVAIVVAVITGLFMHMGSAHRSAQTPLTNTELQRWYEGVNEEYYANRLPKNVTVQWGDLTQALSMGVTDNRLDGSYVIILDRATNPVARTAIMTEDHEICHIAVPVPGLGDKHTPEFEKCMLRLAESGAFKGIW